LEFIFVNMICIVYLFLILIFHFCYFISLCIYLFLIPMVSKSTHGFFKTTHGFKFTFIQGITWRIYFYHWELLLQNYFLHLGINLHIIHF
jgi:hypothetical protein